MQTESEIMGFCEKIHQKGIPYILVSRGRKGLLLSSVKQKIKAIAPPVEVDSTAGAGDSVVGGFVLAHSQGKDLTDCVRLSCAAGTATAQTPGTELCHRMDVEEILSKVQISKEKMMAKQHLKPTKEVQWRSFEYQDKPVVNAISGFSLKHLKTDVQRAGRG